MAQQFRVLADLVEGLYLVPSLQLPVTSVSGYQMPSFGLCGYCTDVQESSHTHKLIFKKKLVKLYTVL